MASSTPLSYQTTMPDYPDVSYQAWQRHVTSASGYGSGQTGHTRLGYALNAWASGLPDYNTWRQNSLDSYNAAMSAYNTWLSTGEGRRASAESGEYNPSYFDSGPASASPLNYQDVSPESGFTQMAQGVQGIFSFVQALQGMKMVSAQIAGQLLKNKQQQIINDQLKENLNWKNTILFNQGNLLGYKSDSQAYQNTIRFAPVFKPLADAMAARSHVPSDLYEYSPFSGGKTYNFNGYERSLEYQNAFQNIEFLKAGTALRNIQKEIGDFNKKERKFYVESIQGVYKEFLDNQMALVKGQLSFQPIEQKLRKKAIEWGIGLNAANTAINAAKTVVGMFMPNARVGSAVGVPNWQNNESHTSWLDQMYGSDYLPGF